MRNSITYKLFTNLIKLPSTIIHFVSRLPDFIRNQQIAFWQNIKNIKYSLNNLTKVNMELGIYHLRNQNFADAVLRFKLIDKFWDRGNREASYWMAWVYLLQNDYQKSIMYLQKAKDETALLPFLEKINQVNEIPKEIYSCYRDFSGKSFTLRFSSPQKYKIQDKTEDKNSSDNLAKTLIVCLNQVISKLPQQYEILEIGSNIGLVGQEIKKRMVGNYLLTGLEISKEMTKLQSDSGIYDQVIPAFIETFSNHNKQYELIISLNGFSYHASLLETFRIIYNQLAAGGYFAFCVRTDLRTYLATQYLEFTYSQEQIIEELIDNQFEILFSRNFSLATKNNYAIFIAVKK